MVVARENCQEARSKTSQYLRCRRDRIRNGKHTVPTSTRYHDIYELRIAGVPRQMIDLKGLQLHLVYVSKTVPVNPLLYCAVVLCCICADGT